MRELKLWCVSDTHTQHEALDKFGLPKPGEYDVLIHSGDYSGRGSAQDTLRFGLWLEKMKAIFKYIVFVPGNHDFIFQNNEGLAKTMLPEGVFYLNNSGCEIEGFKFWGSPITPTFFDWAFMADKGEEIKKYWDLVPADTEVLVTHGPPLNILDAVPHKVITYPLGGEKTTTVTLEHCGCEELAKAVARVKPLVHVFGHIHEGYGLMGLDGTMYINASSMDGDYRLVNPPIKYVVIK